MRYHLIYQITDREHFIVDDVINGYPPKREEFAGRELSEMFTALTERLDRVSALIAYAHFSRHHKHPENFRQAFRAFLAEIGFSDVGANHFRVRLADYCRYFHLKTFDDIADVNFYVKTETVNGSEMLYVAHPFSAYSPLLTFCRCEIIGAELNLFLRFQDTDDVSAIEAVINAYKLAEELKLRRQRGRNDVWVVKDGNYYLGGRRFGGCVDDLDAFLAQFALHPLTKTALIFDYAGAEYFSGENLAPSADYDLREIVTKNLRLPETSGVYLLYNQTKDKYYVGQAENFQHRILKQHFRKQKCLNPAFANDFNGVKDNWRLSIILCPKAELNAVEYVYISKLSAFVAGYNLTPGNEKAATKYIVAHPELKRRLFASKTV